MINLDSLIKTSRILSGPDWPDTARALWRRWEYVKSGFPGITGNDTTLIWSSQVRPGDRVILDPGLAGIQGTDWAALLGIWQGPGHGLLIEGIGAGTDFERDPDRLIRPGTVFPVSLADWRLVIRVDAVPRPGGGPMYYYFEKHPRDARW